MDKSILLVEGRCEKRFYKALCQRLNFPHVTVQTPRGCSEFEGNILEPIPLLLSNVLKQVADNSIHQLGIIVDADYSGINGGFAERWQQITQVLQRANYITDDLPHHAYTGSIFEHSDGLPPIGLWIMPNHFDDGVLEDFIKSSIQDKTSFKIAEKYVRQLPNPLFAPYQLSQVVVYTWLAWQQNPSQELAATIQSKTNLLDLQSQSIQTFGHWLNCVFGE